jgi:hypothetical protein
MQSALSTLRGRTTMVGRVDREEMARAARRRRAEDELDSERERERMLVEEIEDLLAESEGARIDDAAFAAMDPEAAELVRAVFDSSSPGEEEELEEEFEGVSFADDEDEDPDELREEEVRRLEAVLGECRRKQHALEQYLAALGGPE